jgi:hypothetical protein
MRASAVRWLAELFSEQEEQASAQPESKIA